MEKIQLQHKHQPINAYTVMRISSQTTQHNTTQPNPIQPNTKPPPRMSKEIFSMGACVRVDPSTTSRGGIGFVSAVHTEERKVDIDCIQNSIGTINFFPSISESRLHPHVCAWGKSKSTINKIDIRTLADATLTASRKGRVGSMLVPLFSLMEQKKKQVYTPVDSYKRYNYNIQTQQHTREELTIATNRSNL